MTNNIMAIDPGLNGGVAWVKDGSVSACVMPTFSYQTSTRRKRKVSANVLADICREINPVVVYCENVGAMRKGKKPQGAVSMFTFGMTLGVIHGVAGALNIPMELVLPRVWKNVVLPGTDKDKDAAIYFCDNHFPEVSLYKSSRCKKPHDGIADALCILHYAILIMKANPKSVLLMLKAQEAWLLNQRLETTNPMYLNQIDRQLETVQKDIERISNDQQIQS